MSKGWKNESARHSLASRGLKTIPKKSVTKNQIKSHEKLEYEIATKVGSGRRKLTRVEFSLAQDFGFFDKNLTYDDLNSIWYEGDGVQGYLHTKNGKIVNKIGQERIDSKTGHKVHTVSILGWLHREEIDPKYLTREQKKMW